MWRGGCIIRSAFLGNIKEAFDRNPKLANLLLDPYFTAASQACQDGWRRAVAAAVTHGIPLPGLHHGPGLFTTATAAPGCRPTCCRPSATYFGAHTYERIDQPARQVLPHQLDRPGRHDRLNFL